MKKASIYFSLLFVITFSGYAQTTLNTHKQNPYKGNIRVTFGNNDQNRDIVTLKADLDFMGIRLGTNRMITFTPSLSSLDGLRQIDFDPYTITGKKRGKVMRRNNYFSGKTNLPTPAYQEDYKINPDGSLTFEKKIPFEKWMLNSQMIIVEHTAGCCEDLQTYADGNVFKTYNSLPFTFPEPYKPNFAVCYMAAPSGQTKIMQETYSAQLNFKVNQTDLLRQFGNNERVLAEVDEIINRVKNDSLLTIRRIIVRGYSSPEGSAANNQRLSEGRARAFVAYIHYRHNYYERDKVIFAEGCGEDWAGLRKAVNDHPYFQDKQHVLNIIDNTYNPESRKIYIKALSDGSTYRMMLNELYPALRRNEYTIEYEVRGFNEEEARNIFKTRLQLLSLEEMFMIANLYEPTSPEFKEVFDVAARLFPDSQIAQFNVAAMEIENGSYDTAIKRLEKIDTPEALNNLGIAYLLKKELDEARSYLNRAADLGNEYAVKNLVEFEKWLEDMN